MQRKYSLTVYDAAEIRRKLLADIDKFCKAARMSAAAFGYRALKDNAFVYRLRAKPDYRLRGETEAKVRRFIISHDPSKFNCPTCGQKLPIGRHKRSKGK